MQQASSADDIGARLAALPERVNRDAVLVRRGRTIVATCQLVIGDEAALLRIIDGRVAELRRGPFATPSADFAIIGEEATWHRLLAANPPPGDHDLFAFVKRNELHLVGNLHPLFAHLLYFKQLLACLRAGS